MLLLLLLGWAAVPAKQTATPPSNSINSNNSAIAVALNVDFDCFDLDFGSFRSSSGSSYDAIPSRNREVDGDKPRDEGVTREPRQNGPGGEEGVPRTEGRSGETMK